MAGGTGADGHDGMGGRGGVGGGYSDGRRGNGFHGFNRFNGRRDGAPLFVNSLAAMAEDASGDELHDLLVAATALLSVLYARNNVLEIFDHVSEVSGQYPCTSTSTPTPTPTPLSLSDPRSVSGSGDDGSGGVGGGSGVRTVGGAVGGAVVRCLGTSEDRRERTKKACHMGALRVCMACGVVRAVWCMLCVLCVLLTRPNTCIPLLLPSPSSSGTHPKGVLSTVHLLKLVLLDSSPSPPSPHSSPRAAPTASSSVLAPTATASLREPGASAAAQEGATGADVSVR